VTVVAPSPADRDAVADLLGRAPQGAFEVVVRAADGAPVVIRNAPLLVRISGGVFAGGVVAQVVAAFEARFPDTKVEVVTVPVEREFLVTQLSGGAAPDIVSVNVEDVWVDAQKQWYVPMDQFLDPRQHILQLFRYLDGSAACRRGVCLDAPAPSRGCSAAHRRLG